MEINVGDIVNAEVRKADVKQEAGLKLEERNGKIYVRKVDGLFKRRNVPLLPGDRIHTINGKDVEDYPGGLNEIKALIQREMKIWIKFERINPDDEDSEPEAVDDDWSVEEEDDEEVLLLEGPEEVLHLEYQDGNEEDAYAEDVSDEEDEEEELPRLTNGSAPTAKSSSTTNGRGGGGGGVVESGMEMRLFKIQKKPKLNGTHVKVLKPGDKPGRWEVKLLRHPKREIPSGSIMSVAAENLKAL